MTASINRSTLTIESAQKDIEEKKKGAEEVARNIFLLTSTIEFNRDIKKLIEVINTNPVGQRLLAKIGSAKVPVFLTFGKIDKASPLFVEEYITAKLNPPVQITFSNEDMSCFSTSAEIIPLPRDVVLFHELTHAYHYVMNKYCMTQTCDPIVWSNDEEYKTIVGFPSRWQKTTPKITENAYRRAKGLQERYGHAQDLKWAMSNVELLRIKLLGSRYESRVCQNPNNLNPPPMDLCQLEDLGRECYAMINVVYFDSSKNESKTYIPVPAQRHPFGLIQSLGIELILKGSILN